jgi:hypothetical protein
MSEVKLMTKTQKTIDNMLEEDEDDYQPAIDMVASELISENKI